MDHCFHDRPRRLDQKGPNLFEQLPPLVGRERLDQLPFSRGQHALEAYHEEIADQISADVTGPATDVLLLKASDQFANSAFDLTPGFRRDTGDVQKLCRRRGGAGAFDLEILPESLILPPFLFWRITELVFSLPHLSGVMTVPLWFEDVQVVADLVSSRYSLGGRLSDLLQVMTGDATPEDDDPLC